MNPSYLLVFGDASLESEDITELKTFAKTITVYWEIFRVYKSAFVPSRYRNLTITDMEEIMFLRNRNWTYSGLARRFHCSVTKMNRILKSLNI